MLHHLRWLPAPISALYERMLWRLVPRSFDFWQRLGVHLTLNHYYEPTPDTRRLKADLWQQTSELPGIDMNEARQLRLLASFSSAFKSEYSRFARHKTPLPYEYHFDNGWFEAVDAEVLYCMIRRLKPRRILEIGSGYSTYVSAAAVRKNREEGHDCELVAVEPYPNDTLKKGFPGLSKLVVAEVQDVPLAEFQRLEENDILFIDSSHVAKVGSDVPYEFLEILPRLAHGVVIHVHDIFMPAEYPKHWILGEHRFWNEQYVLQAFLIFNKNVEVLWASYYMHLQHPDKLESTFGSYDRGCGTRQSPPASFWMRMVR